MLRHTNRPDARPAAAVRNAKGLMQIEMTNVGAVIAGATKAALCVHVRTVHVNLAAVPVHDLANLANARLAHAVRARLRPPSLADRPNRYPRLSTSRSPRL